MTYWQLHYHLIWATFERQTSITPEREKMLYGVLYGKAEELGLKIHAAGSVLDHVHVVVSIPPRIAVADCVRHLKGASAYAINGMGGSDGRFRWQEGYGALTLGEEALPRLSAYAARQKEHHRERSLLAVYERLDEEPPGD